MEADSPNSLHAGVLDRPDQHDGASGGRARAIVIGGSMAGLLAARVLADHFDGVTVVERDRLPSGPDYRAGVPQARQVHALLVRGYRVLNDLFPGLEAELVAAGAPRVDWHSDFCSLLMGGWSPRFPSDLVTHTCSRTLLEYLIRRHLAARSNVRILERCEVEGLLYDGEGSTVTGVRVRPRGEERDDLPGKILGDLVVDASGRSSRTPAWLEAFVYARPEETVINAFLGYATRWYRRPPDGHVDWKALILSTRAPDQRRGGVVYPVEGDRWIVTLGGIAGEYPPTDEEGFLEFARTLRSPILYDAIKEAEPLTPIWGYQRTDNCLRHYERLARWPERFVVMGDAACAFNPIYGQGMTVASLEAVALGQLLEEHRRRAPHDLAGLSHRFQTRLATIVQTPWLMATGEDLRWPTTEGDRPHIGPVARLMQRYIDQVLVVVSRSPTVLRAFTGVAHLVKPPTQLVRPDVVLQVARHTLVRRGEQSAD